MYRRLRGSMGMLDNVNPTRLSKRYQMSSYTLVRRLKSFTSSPCPILTPINLYHSSPKILTTIQSSWNTQPHMRQQIEVQRTSWGQGCSPFCCQTPLLRSDSTQLQPTPSCSAPYLTPWHLAITKYKRFHIISSYFQKKKRLLTSWTLESHMTPSTKYQRHNLAICKYLFALLHFCFVTREITCFFSPLILMPWSKHLLRLLCHLSFCFQSLKMEETYTVSNLWRFREKSEHKPGNQPWVTLWQIPPCILLPFLASEETMTW